MSHVASRWKVWHNEFKMIHTEMPPIFIYGAINQLQLNDQVTQNCWQNSCDHWKWCFYWNSFLFYLDAIGNLFLWLLAQNIACMLPSTGFFYTELSSASVYRLNYWQAHAICSNTIWRPIASDSSRKMSSIWNQPKEIYRTKGK